MELKSEDEIEFGIDIVGDNGVGKSKLAALDRLRS
jgi:hypothetical protein